MYIMHFARILSLSLNIQYEFDTFVNGWYIQGRRRRGGGAAGACAPALSKVGGHKWVCAPPPTFGQIKCPNFAISSYFKVKNAKFSWLASLANLTLLLFSELS